MSYKSTQCYIESFTHSQTLTRRSNNKIILENIKVVQLEHIPFRHAGITVYLSLSDKLTQSVYSTVSIVAKIHSSQGGEVTALKQKCGGR